MQIHLSRRERVQHQARRGVVKILPADKKVKPTADIQRYVSVRLDVEHALYVRDSRTEIRPKYVTEDRPMQRV